MIKITSLEPNVDQIELDDKVIYLVGTAHISRQSVELTERIIRTHQPDTVAVELCQPRFVSMRSPDVWREMDLLTVLRDGKALVLLAQLALASFQKKLGSQLEVKPGAEMLKAVELSNEMGSELVLADREVRVTLRRVWASLSFWGMIKLINTILIGLFDNHKVSDEEIEKLKEGDALHAALEEFSKTFPSIRKILIDERDSYLAKKIESAPGKTVVAIIGAGHCPGIKSKIGSEVDLATLEDIPKMSWGSLAVKWSVPVALMLLVVYVVLNSGAQVAFSYLWLWAVVTAFYASLGCLVTLTHPLTALITVITAPFTMLVPIFKPGLVGALVETYLRKPRVRDMETVLEDMTNFKGWYHNRVAHVFLIFMVNNIIKWPAVGTLGLLGIAGVAV